MSERPNPSGPESGQDDLFSAGLLKFDSETEPESEVIAEEETPEVPAGSTAVERLNDWADRKIAEVEAHDEQINSVVSPARANETSDRILSTVRTVDAKLAAEAAARDEYMRGVEEAREAGSAERAARAQQTSEMVKAAFPDRPELSRRARETIEESKARSDERAKWNAIYARMAGSDEPDEVTRTEWSNLINSVPEAQRIALKLKLEKARRGE